MTLPTALERIRHQWLTQNELAQLFNVAETRIQDMKSHGKLEIPTVKLSSKAYWYHVDDVLEYMMQNKAIYEPGTRDEED